MRILFVLEYYYPHVGGVETLFKSLVDKLDQKGHQITILTNRFDPSLPKKEKQGSNTTIHRYNFFNRYLFTFLAFWPAIRLARSADVIHTTSYNAALPAWIAAKWTRSKSVITFHEYWGSLWLKLPWMTSFSRRLHRAFERMITRLTFDKFIGVSHFTSDSLIKSGVKESKVTTIYNGIEYDATIDRPNREDDSFRFLYFGRVGVGKGLDVLVDAYSLLSQKETPINHNLVMVIPEDESSYKKKLFQQIQKSNLEGKVKFHHSLSFRDLQDLIRNSDAVVIPSYSEGFCFAAVETMAIGTPIISSGKGALQEVIGGKHITLSELTPSHLYEAMSQALKGEWNYLEMKRFPLESTIEQYVAVYSQL